ncbi:mycofactocin-coupled SDR family oxidoreductase [Streptomyces sp. NPDC004561]
MAGRVEGKVALVTGAARGQGRAHAVRLAQEGADIIALDIADQIDTVPFAMGTSSDLAQTAKDVESLGRRIVARQADVRDLAQVRSAVAEGVAELGRLDVVVANAAVAVFGPGLELSEEQWRVVLDVNLTGVWHTAKAAIDHIRAGGNGGSVILVSSVMGLRGAPNLAAYVSAKHGVVGLARTLAIELAPENIRVNAINPGTVNTPMLQNPAMYALFAPDLPVEERTTDVIKGRMSFANALPVPWLEPVDIANAALFLASDEARYITGITLPVDAGSTLK